MMLFAKHKIYYNMEALIQIIKIIIIFFLILAAIGLIESGNPILGLLLLIIGFVILGYDPSNKTIWKIKL